ncbi:Protein CBG17872 [Caenorhabditis briggsae]|nr:Protein CBG17872 [Caenorhabditis briggsae]CAP35415.1 Protein CBG17872 [Caenorhabditis briggsae]
MSINLGKSDGIDVQAGKQINDLKIAIYGNNVTSSVVHDAYQMRVTPHDFCEMITVFASVGLMPKLKLARLVSDDGSTEVPFSIPSYGKHDVVTCFSPIYVYEQWQNFLLAVHIYKKFGAFMHIYLISCITSIFKLMQRYEAAGYMRIQPWNRVNFPYVPSQVVDPFVGIEFQNQAAAHTDCLLRYKKPTISRVIADTRYVNYTWIYPNSYSIGSDYYKVTENTITHLDDVKWRSYHKYQQQAMYLNSNDPLISAEDVIKIEKDFLTMIDQHGVRGLLPELPERYHFTNNLSKCLNDNYYHLLKHGNVGKIRCPGPQVCEFPKLPNVMCVHVNATHVEMVKTSPITFYFSTDPYFTSDIGCRPQ